MEVKNNLLHLNYCDKMTNHVCRIGTLLPDTDLHQIKKEFGSTFLPDADLHQGEIIQICLVQNIHNLAFQNKLGNIVTV